jgi:hypothetical protein
VVVIQISVDEEDYLVPMYLKQKPASATMLVAKAQGKQIQTLYSVEGIPANFIIDKSGVIRNYGYGYGPGVSKTMREWIDADLGTAARK